MTELKGENALLKEEILYDKCILAAKDETISFLNKEEKKMKKEKNDVWDRNTQLKTDIEKLEKKIKRQQETITEQRKDIVRLRKYEVIVGNAELC